MNLKSENTVIFKVKNIGIVGVYVGKTFTEVKKRPIFIINETLGLEK